jgi:hypothetical protein
MSDDTSFPVVHIWSPESFHDTSYIVGNYEGLERLYMEIGTVLNKKKGKVTTELFVTDGEGFDMEVILVEDKDLDKIAVPYQESYAEEKREHAVYPWDM